MYRAALLTVKCVKALLFPFPRREVYLLGLAEVELYRKRETFPWKTPLKGPFGIGNYLSRLDRERQREASERGAKSTTSDPTEFAAIVLNLGSPSLGLGGPD